VQPESPVNPDLIILLNKQSLYLAQKFSCMNRIATWLSVVSLVLVGLLYYFHFTHVDLSKLSFKTKRVDTAAIVPGHFKIAYFEMDSVYKNYEYAIFIRESLKKRESELQAELHKVRLKYQRQWSERQNKGVTSQAEADKMNQEYEQMQVSFNAEQKQLNDEYETVKYNMYVDANKRISEFLKEFNKDKGYSYIIADQPNLFYYKDTLYNITQELIEGLNILYKEQDKKK